MSDSLRERAEKMFKHIEAASPIETAYKKLEIETLLYDDLIMLRNEMSQDKLVASYILHVELVDKDGRMFITSFNTTDLPTGQLKSAVTICVLAIGVGFVTE